jgi:putative restriction endonuclease
MSMVKAVFDTRPGSGYQDSVEFYDFPKRYLPHASQAVGEWVVYYQPKRGGGRSAYIGVARLREIRPNPAHQDRYLAVMEDFLPFDTLLPFQGGGGYREEPFRLVSDTRAIGRALQGKSIRPLSDSDFTAIVNDGLDRTLAQDNARRVGLEPGHIDPGTRSLIDEPPAERKVERMLVNRTIRDAAFRGAVLDAYDSTCAVTGLRIVNGGGRAEAQAAHIVPVADKGLDIVQNGIALSATAHWLFDRHMISIGQDWSLLISHNKVPEAYQSLFVQQEHRIMLPMNPANWPDPRFVAQHRDVSG